MEDKYVAFNRLMVGLDFTEIDANLIQYTAFFAKCLSPEKIYFVHVEKELEPVAEDVVEQFPELKGPVDEGYEEKMKKEVEENFPDYKSFGVEFEVHEGSEMKELLHWIHIKSIDVFIAGKKKHKDGSGHVPKKFARMSDCSILYVPEGKTPELQNTLVPVDFSECSARSLEVAQKLRESLKQDIAINVMHTYRVHTGYYKTGKTFDEFAEIMRNNAEKAYKRFVKKYELDKIPHESPVYVLDANYNHAQSIYDEAKREDTDLLIVGSHGKNFSASFLLGSVTEELVDINTEVPMLIYKRRGNRMGFLKAISEL